MLIAYFRRRDSHEWRALSNERLGGDIRLPSSQNGEINNCPEPRERLQARKPSVLFRFGYRHLALCLAGTIDSFVHKK